MDHLNIYESASSSSDCNHDKVEPGELLEDCWFFGNLLDTKTRKMSRSFSDPSTSSNFSKQNLPGKSYEETYESIKKLPKGFVGPNLLKTPSLPPRIERKDRNPSMKGSFSDPPKNKIKSSNSLLRAPSLPNILGAEDESDHDEEIEFSMGKLIRQASLNSKSNTLSPTTLVPKVATPNSTISRNRSKKKSEVQWSKPDYLEEVIRPNRLKPQKSFNDVESRELQGFKDMGFDFNKMDLNPSPISSFQEKQRIEENNTKAPPYVPSAPPVPKFGGKRSSEDVKAHIKFWARAVASNVRQEC